MAAIDDMKAPDFVRGFYAVKSTYQKHRLRNVNELCVRYIEPDVARQLHAHVLVGRQTRELFAHRDRFHNLCGGEPAALYQEPPALSLMDGDLAALAPLREMPMVNDFYLAHRMGPTVFIPQWRLHVPADLA